MTILIEIIPVILAIVTLYTCVVELPEEHRQHDRTLLMFAIVATVLFISTQLAAWSFLVLGATCPPWFVDISRSVTSTVTMLCFIQLATRRKPW